MITHIKTVHEEPYSNKGKVLGILLNFSSEPKHEGWKESFAYIYREGMYIFFDRIQDMYDYLLYGEDRMKRAYMEEVEFDQFFDADFIDGEFGDVLKWI